MPKIKLGAKKLFVLDMILTGIQVVYDSITKRFFRAPGPRTKYLERNIFRSITI